jgi:DNA-binding transcriptional LysR family regulator
MVTFLTPRIRNDFTMLIDSLNLNVLRIFERVYSLRSMTHAAEELHLTQSGVSQHIYNLEQQLDIKLFDRIKKQLIPTDKAHHLFKVCSQSLHSIEDELWNIRDVKRELSGSVTIGMPSEFGQNIVQPLLAEFIREHENVSLNLVLEFTPILNQEIINGNIDFAFVDDFTTDPRINTEKVYDEFLDLCISNTALKKYGSPDGTRKFFESLDYIDYFDGEPVLRQWFTRQFKFRDIDLKVRAYVANPQGVARFICMDLGAGVLPDHVYQKLIKEGKNLVCLEGATGKGITNTIHLAHLKQRTLSPLARELKTFLSTKLAARNNN